MSLNKDVKYIAALLYEIEIVQFAASACAPPQIAGDGFFSNRAFGCGRIPNSGAHP
jgi:hypothetical protein